MMFMSSSAEKLVWASAYLKSVGFSLLGLVRTDRSGNLSILLYEEKD